MLNIVIVNGLANGDLELQVNGRPTNGKSKAEKNEDVHWRVDQNCNVERIDHIGIKTGPDAPPSTDIFSENPPAPQGGPHSKHWKAKVNRNAPVGAEYNYDIVWVPKVGGGSRMYDPKITVKPSTSVARVIIQAIVLAFVALCSLFTLRYLLSAKYRK